MARLVLLLMCFLFPSLGGVAQPLDPSCTQEGVSACIDWDRQVVLAEGSGAPASSARTQAQQNATAERAARLDAARNALEMIKGVNLSASTKMQDAMLASDQVSTKVQGMLYGLRTVGAPRFFSDGSIRVRVEASLKQVIPEDLLETTEAPEAVPEASGAPTSPRIDFSAKYTGLVIDARGTDLQPAMAPKVLDASGDELYGSAYVDANFVRQHGMAGYVRSPEQAQENDRVAGNPLLLEATGTSGPNQTDVVISTEDAEALRKLAQKLPFLKEARVVMILN